MPVLKIFINRMLNRSTAAPRTNKTPKETIHWYLIVAGNSSARVGTKRLPRVGAKWPQNPYGGIYGGKGGYLDAPILSYVSITTLRSLVGVFLIRFWSFLVTFWITLVSFWSLSVTFWSLFGHFLVTFSVPFKALYPRPLKWPKTSVFPEEKQQKA